MDERKPATKDATGKSKRTAEPATAPWERGNPKGKNEHKSLSPQAKSAAKRNAKKAGRPYPNLVDNMRAAGASKK